MTFKQEVLRVAYVLGALFCLVLFGLFIIGDHVKVEFEADCTSGDIDGDIELNNFIQSKNCTKMVSSGTSIYGTPQYEEVDTGKTCFEEDLLLKHIKLTGLDGMNCKVKAKVNAPVWYVALMENR